MEVPAKRFDPTSDFPQKRQKAELHDSAPDGGHD